MKNFLTLHGYTCSDTVNTIAIFEIIVVLKVNYLHIQNGILQVLRPLFLFSQTLTYLHVVTCIFSFVSNFFPIYAYLLWGHIKRGCLSLLGRAMK